MNIVWIDLETGGTDKEIHQITQIAAVATGGPPHFEGNAWPFERKIKLVEGHYTEEALKVQNYSPEVWERDAMDLIPALNEFIQWVKPYCHQRISKRTGRPYDVAHMAGYNISFDGDFLRASCDRNKLWMPLTNWTGGQFDVLHAVKWHLMKQKVYPETFTLEAMCETFGIKLDAHDAMNDVLATVELARKVVGHGVLKASKERYEVAH